MRFQAAGSVIALFACAAFGQTDRVLRFAHTDGKQDQAEVATLVRTITGIKPAPDSGKHPENALEVHGTAEQIELAEWLFHELDKPAVGAPNNLETAVHEFQVEGGGENTVRIFYLRNTPTIKAFQEAATAIRTAADIRRVSTYNGPRAMAMRGTPDQIALAAFLVGAVDRAPGQPSSSIEYRMPASAGPRGETVTRVFYIQNAATVQDFQETATVVRTLADIRRVTSCGDCAGPRPMIVRSSEAAVAFAAWLIDQLDRAAPADQDSARYQYEEPFARDHDNIARIFYFPQTATIAQFQQIATRLRSGASLRRVCTYNTARAMAVRGTVDQVATAERMVRELEARR